MRTTTGAGRHGGHFGRGAGARIAIYETDSPGTYREVFYPEARRGARGRGGDPHGRPEPAAVVVRAGAEPEVVGYTPPATDLPGVGRADDERQAVAAVQAGQGGSR